VLLETASVTFTAYQNLFTRPVRREKCMYSYGRNVNPSEMDVVVIYITVDSNFHA